MKPEVILEVIYPYPPDRVWQALTDRRALAKWLLPNNFEPRAGHRFQFVRNVPGSAREVIECEVIDLQPPFRLVYTWHAASDQAPSVVTWALEPVPGGTRLRLSHTRADGVAAAHETDAAWGARLAELHRLLRSVEIGYHHGQRPAVPLDNTPGGSPRCERVSRHHPCVGGTRGYGPRAGV